MSDDRKASLLAEASEIAMHHPSKDAKAFACAVSDYLLATKEGAAEPGQIYWHNPESGQVWSDADVRFHCKDTTGWSRIVIPAPPPAAMPAAPSDAVRAALEWYRDEAEAIARYLVTSKTTALTASMQVLGLDAGRRASEALSQTMQPQAAQPEGQEQAGAVADALNVYGDICFARGAGEWPNDPEREVPDHHDHNKAYAAVLALAAPGAAIAAREQDYPPLPEPQYSGFGYPLYIDHQMRDYVDADRATRGTTTEALPSHQEMADRMANARRGSMCPLCGWDTPHQHSPEEIIIYRNGVKWGRNNGKEQWTGEVRPSATQNEPSDAIRVGRPMRAPTNQHHEHRAGESNPDRADADGNCGGDGVHGDGGVQEEAVALASRDEAPATPQGETVPRTRVEKLAADICAGSGPEESLALLSAFLRECAALTQPATVQQAEPDGWRAALQFYADRSHFAIADDDAWDTVSGEPQNFWCDEAGTATIEDGTVAAMALAGTPLRDADEEAPQGMQPGERGGE